MGDFNFRYHLQSAYTIQYYNKKTPLNSLFQDLYFGHKNRNSTKELRVVGHRNHQFSPKFEIFP